MSKLQPMEISLKLREKTIYKYYFWFHFSVLSPPS